MTPYKGILFWVFVAVMAVHQGLAAPQDLDHSKKNKNWNDIRAKYGDILEIPIGGGEVATSSESTNQAFTDNRHKGARAHSHPSTWHLDPNGQVPSVPFTTWSPHAGHLQTIRIRVPHQGFSLFAMPATGEVVGVYFIGTANTNGEAVDAAEASFKLFSQSQGISWTVTGADLGWSGQGNFGPSRSSVTQDFNGPLVSDDDVFVLWESRNQSPWAGDIGNQARSSGHFYVTVRHPSPVALSAHFAADGPGPFGAYTILRDYSHSEEPDFQVDYIYEEDLGYWEEQLGRPCHQGEHNDTNFYLGIYNLTGNQLTGCRFQASWDQQTHECSQPIVDDLNEFGFLLIRTEDYLYVPSSDCSEFTPTDEHVISGETHWMWVEFDIGGVSYPRKMVFVKQ